MKNVALILAFVWILRRVFPPPPPQTKYGRMIMTRSSELKYIT